MRVAKKTGGGTQGRGRPSVIAERARNYSLDLIRSCFSISVLCDYIMLHRNALVLRDNRWTICAVAEPTMASSWPTRF